MSKIKIFSLGGLNEIGKNMYVVEIDDSIFILDAGLKYADDKLLGIDYIIPNFDYIKENKDRIKGIFITHGHDQQMGAIPDIIEEIKDIKVYGTRFTIEVLKQELITEGISVDNLVLIEPHKKIDFGNVSIFPISLTHSVPDSVGYVINTKDGAIVYTGNFVFDATMPGSYKTDIGKLAYVGKQGVLCLLSESLYSEKKGYTAPNNRITSIVKETLNKNDKRIIFNISSAQLYRLQEILTSVEKVNRKVIILGKRLESFLTKGIELGYIDFDKNNIGTIKNINDEGVIVIVSDEREKPFSNIKRIVKGYDRFIKIKEEDTVVFASPIYDGMEKRATDIFNQIAKMGANLIIISSDKYLSHHASSEDLMMMINLMNPKYYFPVIGEYRHQVENAKLAYSTGMKEENVILKTNGGYVEIVNGKLIDNNEKVKVDDILIDGKNSNDIGELVLKDREVLGDNGVVIVVSTIDYRTKKIIIGPDIITKGFAYSKESDELLNEAKNISLKVINENIKPNYVDFNKIKQGIRENLGRYLYKETECNPMILIVIQEV